MDNIFNLIKLKNFTKVKELIINDKKLNVNIHDEQNNYLIHYILLNNQYDILELLLKRNIRLDILDTDGRTILYSTIKYNYIDLLELLLKYNSELIGISIVDIKDKIGFTTLHYCVILNNYDCLKLLIKYNANPLIKDNNGYNTLHLSLHYDNNKILKYLIEIVKLNFLTNNHETLLQLACVYKNIEIINLLLQKQIDLNNQENEYGLSIIHQSIALNQPSITDKIIKNGADINLQDFYGNTALMYAINDKLIECIQVFINYSHLNYDLTNSYGETALHLIFKDYETFVDYDNIISALIKNTDLNIQDNNGNTCLYFIVTNNLVEMYKDILEQKELNIFIKDINNVSSYDFIKDNQKLINIIINSYYNYLKKNKDKLIIDWEIWCANDDNDKLKKLQITGTNDEKCKKQINNIIMKENRSIPKVTNIDLILDNGIFVDTCYYTGAPIDILFGLVFLYNTFKKDELNIIVNYPLTHNKPLEEHFKSLGINYNYKLDFCNFEIIWSYQKLIFPTYFIHELKLKIKTNLYIVIPIGIELHNGAHANILFYDVKKSTIERFEPNGANQPKGFNYNSGLLDQLLEIQFKNINPKIKYIKPSEYLPIIGFQILENINNTKCTRIGDPNGFCGIWCIWWIYHKMKNINIDSKTLALKLINEIKFKNISFKTLIRNFTKSITDLRDDLLKKHKIDINDFIVGNYTSDILNKLEKDIIKLIE
jgi:ankyrin repeat protein